MTIPAAGSTPEEIAARAASRHVVVVGGGIGGLVAAREFASVGIRVTLLEEADALGGAIRRAELDGLVVDAGAESFATRGGHVRALIEELGLADRVVAPAAGGAWLSGIPGAGAAPLPVGGILGIPANPFQEDVRQIIGWGGAWRAYLDRVRPPLTIGHERSLGRLVASRMGSRVRDRLVAPVTTGVYSASPDDVDVDAAAPGLNAALTRVGSLSGAVAALREEGAARAVAAPGAAVQGVVGGMGALVDALAADLDRLGAVVRTGVAVRGLTRTDAGWTVALATAPETAAPETAAPETAGPETAAPAAATENPETAAPATATEDPEDLLADAVIVAVDESTARSLLAGQVAGLDAAPVVSPEIEVVTLLLDAPVLDAAPRGTGVLTVPGSHTAKALTHSTAKWGWLRDAADGRHVVRVSFGAQGEPAATVELDDDDAARLALREASALLGVRLEPHMLLGAHRARFRQAQPASILGAADRRAEARTAIRRVPGLAVVGAWLAGTGLAQVVPDAKEEGDRLRSSLLWG